MPEEQADSPPPSGGAGRGAEAPRLDDEATRAINQRLFDTSIDLILVVDRQGSVIRVSPSSAAILGYRPAEMVGRSAAEFVFPGDLDSTRVEMRQARRGRATRHFDCRYVHKDGRVVPLTWTGVWSEPERQFFFIGRDMTERLAAEERLRRSQRLEALGQLTGGIAHDFNNLLAIVVGHLELVFDEPGLSPAIAEHATAAMHAAQRGAELTHSLLAFARQQPLEPRLVDANELVEGVVRLLRRTIGENVEIAFEPEASPWPVFVDPGNLESAITNLALNARDAMPDGGRLVFETRNATLDADYARDNPGATPGEYLAVTVSDNGIGMAPEVLDRIFEPFFTTKEPGRGTGLGLSMVFGFVKQSGGHIKAYSEVGHGTSMRLYLPRAAQPAETATEHGPEAQPSQPQGGERILVVEDNEAIRQVVLLQLGKLGYRTLQAANAEAALAVLNEGEPIDLLFTDIVLVGGVNGQTLAEEALKLRPNLKVLFTSGFPGALLAQQAGGVGGVLRKPYRLQELASKVREALDR